ncbi:MAG: hypothetical protein H6644_09950 [Caldilineaceae bacterium]|nr:hypothetical protein [Caldilineaceae bacterium]
MADTGGARIVLLDRNGAQMAEYGGLGTALGRGQPVDAVQAADTLWAVTSEDGRLWDLDVNGSVVATQRAVSADGPHLARWPTAASSSATRPGAPSTSTPPAVGRCAASPIPTRLSHRPGSPSARPGTKSCSTWLTLAGVA